MCCFWGGNMSCLLSEWWCGIINLPASSLPTAAEACRFSRLLAVVKTRDRTERGKNVDETERWSTDLCRHACLHTKKACNGVGDTHTNRATHLHRHKEIDSFHSLACTSAGTHQPNRSYCVKWKAQMRSWMDWWTVFIMFQSASENHWEEMWR